MCAPLEKRKEMTNFVLIFALCVITASSFPLEEIGKNAVVLRRSIIQHNVAVPKHIPKLSNFYNEILKDENKESREENYADDYKNTDNDEENISSDDDESDENEASSEEEEKEDINPINHDNTGDSKDDNDNDKIFKGENNENEVYNRHVGEENEEENGNDDDAIYYVDYDDDYNNYEDFIDDDENNNGGKTDENGSSINKLESRNGVAFNHYLDDNEINSENDERRSSANELLQNRNGFTFDGNLQDNEIGNDLNNKPDESFQSDNYHRNHFWHELSGNEFGVKTNQISSALDSQLDGRRPLSYRPIGSNLESESAYPKHIDRVSGSASDEYWS